MLTFTLAVVALTAALTLVDLGLEALAWDRACSGARRSLAEARR